MTAAWATIDSPLGELVLEADERGVTALRLPNLRPQLDPALHDPDALADALGQVAEYFAGSRRAFDLTLAPSGGDFDLRVWRATSAIPYGETASYGEIARAVGRPDHAREVGGAMAQPHPHHRPVPPRRGVGRSAGRLRRRARAQARAARPGGRAPAGVTLVSG